MTSAAPTPGAAPLAALTGPQRFLLWTLAAVQFTHIVDFMVMMPLGPQLTSLFGLSDAQFGLLVSAYTFSAGAAGVLASFFIDRFERKRLLLVLYAGFGLATLGCGLAGSYPLLMAARVAAGLFGGVLTALVQTIVGESIPYAQRGRAMGIVMSAFSLSTVAGVPASLLLAQHLGWHAPFIGIALASAVVWAGVLLGLPPARGHLSAQAGQNPAAQFAAVLAQRNHWRAFGLSALVMLSSFCVIPYITIYMTINVGIQAAQVPQIYLVGGAATFFTARLWGWASDRYGKVRTFRALALAATLPMMALTHLPALPLAAVLVVTTLFFVFVSGRMVPAMALITASSQPQWRGAFMSLNGAVQSAAMGLASFVGGLLIARDAAGQVVGYGRTGWLALGFSAAAMWLVGRLVHEPAAGPSASPSTAPPAAPPSGAAAASPAQAAGVSAPSAAGVVVSGVASAALPSAPESARTAE